MITMYGMSKRFGLMALETVESQYLENRRAAVCSEATEAQVDEEVMKLLKESYEEAKRLLSENREILDKIAAYLIEKETITGKEFMEIYRREKGLRDPAEEKKESDGKAKGTKDSAEDKAEAPKAEAVIEPAPETVSEPAPEAEVGPTESFEEVMKQETSEIKEDTNV